MKVLHLLGTGKPGGVETFVLQLAQNIPSTECSFSVLILGDDGPMSGALRDAGARVEIRRRGRLSDTLGIASEVSKGEGYDLIHAHSGGRLARVAAARRATIPLISHLHGIPESWTEHLDDVRWLKRRVRELSVGASELAVSSEWMEKLIAKGDPSVPVARLPYGVDTTRFSPSRREELSSNARARLGIPRDAVATGFAGRIVEQKDPREFLDIARHFADDPAAWFVMLGDGPLRLEIEQAVRTLGLERFLFVPATARPDDTMAAFDVTVLSSKWEPFGIVAIESLAFGIPVLAFDVGGIHEAVANGQDSILVPPGDSAAMKDAVARLIKDPDLRRRLGEQGQKRVSRERDARHTSMAVLDHYRELVSSKSSRS